MDIERLIIKFRLAVNNVHTINYYDVYMFIEELLRQLKKDDCKNFIIKTYEKNNVISLKTIYKIQGDFLTPFLITVDHDEYENLNFLIQSNNYIMGGLTMITDSNHKWKIEYYDKNKKIKILYIDENNIKEIFEYTHYFLNNIDIL